MLHSVSWTAFSVCTAVHILCCLELLLSARRRADKTARSLSPLTPLKLRVQDLSGTCADAVLRLLPETLEWRESVESKSISECKARTFTFAQRWTPGSYAKCVCRAKNVHSIYASLNSRPYCCSIRLSRAFKLSNRNRIFHKLSTVTAGIFNKLFPHTQVCTRKHVFAAVV